MPVAGATSGSADHAPRASDGAWIARIISHLDDADIEAIVNEAQLSSPIARSELIRILEGRRNRILRRYLLRLSSLEHPTVEEAVVPEGGPVVCVEDRAERIGLGPAPAPTAKLWYASNAAMVLPRSQRAPAEYCIKIPDIGFEERVLDVFTGRHGQGPLRIHLRGGDPPVVVGLERPESNDPPSG